MELKLGGGLVKFILFGLLNIFFLWWLKLLCSRKLRLLLLLKLLKLLFFWVLNFFVMLLGWLLNLLLLWLNWLGGGGNWKLFSVILGVIVGVNLGVSFVFVMLNEFLLLFWLWEKLFWENVDMGVFDMYLVFLLWWFKFFVVWILRFLGFRWFWNLSFGL